MRIKIITVTPPVVEVGGAEYRVTPLWYDTSYSVEGVIGAIHRSNKSRVEYFELSKVFDKKIDLDEAYSSGFRVIDTEPARRICETLIAAGLAERQPDE
jgi:hypothetical protein